MCTHVDMPAHVGMDVYTQRAYAAMRTCICTAALPPEFPMLLFWCIFYFDGMSVAVELYAFKVGVAEMVGVTEVCVCVK